MAVWISEGDYIPGLSGAMQEEQISPPPANIMKVYIEALTGFSHVCHPESPGHIRVGRLGLKEGSRLWEWWAEPAFKD